MCPYLPKETRNYVLYVAASKVCMNPEAYGFTNLQFEERFNYDVVPISEAVDFRVRSAGRRKRRNVYDLNLNLFINQHRRIPNSTSSRFLSAPKVHFIANYEK